MATRSAQVFNEVAIDRVKEYWNARPCNIRHSTATIGTKEYFDQVEARKYLVEPHIPGFAEFARWNGKKVLEIGCGIGTDTMNFARAGAQVTAIDLSGESIALAEQRAQVFGLTDKVKFYQANAEELSSVVPLEQYDLIYSFGVIHHTPHPERVIEQLKKYCKRDTTVKIMVYHRWSWKVLWILATDGKFQFWKLDHWIARNSEAQTGCPVTYSYSRSTIKNLLQGFRVTKTAVDHVFPFRIPDYKEYRYVKVWYFRWMPDWLFRAFEQRFGWHLCADATPQQ
ncbi:MAG: class I SAM-dependent methyltransferase [bacterium]|nr:class I SAM-dependent methyltransferase [bacterium]